MPNPFDWRGPEFLVFYVTLGLIVIVAVALLRRRSEPVVAMTGPLTDYLKIAYLRGGPDEALRVATISLLDRGLVEAVDEHHVKISSAKMPAGLQRTEQRVLEACKHSTRASAIVDDTSLRITVTTECQAHLVGAGLLPDDKVKADRQWLLVASVAFLGLVALIKIVIALGRGRTNIVFLIAAVAIFGYVDLPHRQSLPDACGRGDACRSAPAVRRAQGSHEVDRDAERSPGTGARRCGLWHRRAAGTRFHREAIVPPAAERIIVVCGSWRIVVWILGRLLLWRRMRRRVWRMRQLMNDRVGLTWHPRLAAAILAAGDRIDIVEVIPEGTFLGSRRAHRALRRLAREIPVAIHGVSLGLALDDGRRRAAARVIRPSD